MNEDMINKRSEAVRNKFIKTPVRMCFDFQEGKISSSAVALYIVLKFKQGINDKVWAGMESLKKSTKYSSSQLSKIMSELENMGYIERKRRLGKPSLTLVKN